MESYGSLAELWEKYPNGANDGFTVLVDGKELYWDAGSLRWRYSIDFPNIDQPLHDFKGDVVVRDRLTVAGTLRAHKIDPAEKGLFSSADELSKTYPFGRKGDWALVGTTTPYAIYYYDDDSDKWVDSGQTYDLEFPLHEYATIDYVNRKLLELGPNQNDGILITTIHISLLDEMASDVASFIELVSTPLSFLVMAEVGGKTINVGRLEIFSDNMLHGITQVFTSNYLLNEDGTLSEGHDHTRVYIYSRFREFDSKTGMSAWSAWVPYATGGGDCLDAEQKQWLLEQMTDISFTSSHNVVEYGVGANVLFTLHTKYNGKSVDVDSGRIWTGAIGDLPVSGSNGSYEASLHIANTTAVTCDVVVKGLGKQIVRTVNAYSCVLYGACNAGVNSHVDSFSKGAPMGVIEGVRYTFNYAEDRPYACVLIPQGEGAVSIPKSLKSRFPYAKDPNNLNVKVFFVDRGSQVVNGIPYRVFRQESPIDVSLMSSLTIYFE